MFATTQADLSVLWRGPWVACAVREFALAEILYALRFVNRQVASSLKQATYRTLKQRGNSQLRISLLGLKLSLMGTRSELQLQMSVQ